jgi:hypothetical protein
MSVPQYAQRLFYAGEVVRREVQILSVGTVFHSMTGLALETTLTIYDSREFRSAFSPIV